MRPPQSNIDAARYFAIGVLRFFDLETKEKLFMALLEIVPTVGLWYALFGRRIRVSDDQKMSLERISIIQRGLYLAGEVLVSGHMLVGAYNSLRRRGTGHVRRRFFGYVIARLRESLTRRFALGVRRFTSRI